jgi:hypothetical protein
MSKETGASPNSLESRRCEIDLLDNELLRPPNQREDGCELVVINRNPGPALTQMSD